MAADQRQQEGEARQCRTCSTTKPVTDFYKAGAGGRYRSRICKACTRGESGERYQQNSDAVRKRAAQDHLRRTYGLSEDDVAALLVQQGNRCAICQELFDGDYHVDHDHETRLVRGLLCMLCNTALGKFKDSAELLQAAIAYLQIPPAEVRQVFVPALTKGEISAVRRRARLSHGPERSQRQSRTMSGAGNPCARLKLEQVLEIRRRYATGEKRTALAKEFGCSHTTINRIVNHVSWRMEETVSNGS